MADSIKAALTGAATVANAAANANAAGGAVRRMMPSLEASARGMSVQQTFLDVIAKNIANAETTHGPNGGPYMRQVATASTDATGTQSTVSVSEDPTPGELVYDPGNPDANSEGFVTMPNVDVSNELVDLMMTRRMYEANATVFSAAKRMLKRAMDI